MTTSLSYYAVISKEENLYGIHFPDLDGCVTSGDSVEEVQALAKDALSLHIEGMKAEGYEVPAPSTDVSAILKEESGDETFYGITLVSFVKNKRTRINVSLWEKDIDLIDMAAEKYGLTRSDYMVLCSKRVALGECAIELR